MIRYALKCTDDHAFESWFKSAQAFDGLQAAGMVACPFCGSAEVEKSVMAPRVRPSRNRPAKPVAAQAKPLSTPKSDTERALAEMRRHVQDNSDYVGLSFATEARRMHDGDIPHRSIYGEAKTEDAKKLIADGIPVAPLPFIPQRKTN